MAYIAPNSIVQLIRGIPWNNTYRDTVFFTNASAQHTAITTSVKYTFTAQSYQRAGKNSIKLNVPCDNIYDCNYMCFQNTSYSNKWFYAFITNVTYINNDTTLVEYEIDVIQTWLFDYTLLPCFIERQHTITDNIGDNIIEESLEIGDLVINTRHDLSTFSSYAVIFACLFSTTWDGTQWSAFDASSIGQKINSCFSGLNFIVCKDDNTGTAISKANALITKATNENQVDAITGVFMYPAQYITNDFTRYEQSPLTSYPKPGYGGSGSISTIDGYTPKNKKLYTYPYSQIMVTDGGNETVPLKYEYFRTAQGGISSEYSFDLRAETAVNPTVAIIPRYYGNSATFQMSVDPYNAILMTGFPMCAWQSDTFKAYIAQTYGPAMAKLTPDKTPANRAVGSVGQAIGGVGKDVTGLAGDILLSQRSARSTMEHSAGFMSRTAMGAMDANTSLIGGAISAADSIFSKISDLSTKFMESNQSHGNVTDSAGVNLGFKGFHVYEMCLRNEFAQIVDDYFSMFGYAIHRVETPIVNARPVWTYIKTVGCKIDAEIPFDHEAIICRIFDNGVTWWKDIDKVGRYDLNNSPI